jgi:uncharacterized protein YbjT (DUF2867 family)
MILITGASGQVGCAVIRALSKSGIATKAFIHSASNIEKVKEAGATEIFVGDMSEEKDLREAFMGVDTAYYICSAANPKEDEIGGQMIQIAKEMGNIYFVYHSVLHSVLQDMPHHRRKLHTEQVLVDSGLDFAIIQPAVFMQMLIPAIKSVQKGGPMLQKFFTSDDTQMSLVDMEDFAEAAAVILSNKDYTNGTYELCGKGSYALPDMEAVFSKVAGREVTSAFITDDAFIGQMKIDKDSYQAQTLLTMFRHYNEHSFRGNNMMLSQILRREPNTLQQFISRSMLE